MGGGRRNGHGVHARCSRDRRPPAFRAAARLPPDPHGGRRLPCGVDHRGVLQRRDPARPAAGRSRLPRRPVAGGPFPAVECRSVRGDRHRAVAGDSVLRHPRLADGHDRRPSDPRLPDATAQGGRRPAAFPRLLAIPERFLGACRRTGAVQGRVGQRAVARVPPSPHGVAGRADLRSGQCRSRPARRGGGRLAGLACDVGRHRGARARQAPRNRDRDAPRRPDGRRPTAGGGRNGQRVRRGSTFGHRFHRVAAGHQPRFRLLLGSGAPGDAGRARGDGARHCSGLVDLQGRSPSVGRGDGGSPDDARLSGGPRGGSHPRTGGRPAHPRGVRGLRVRVLRARHWLMGRPARALR